MAHLGVVHEEKSEEKEAFEEGHEDEEEEEDEEMELFQEPLNKEDFVGEHNNPIYAQIDFKHSKRRKAR